MATVENKMSKEEILNKHEWLPNGGWTKQNILDAMTEYAKTIAESFSEWVEDNHWTRIYSKELDRHAYVNYKHNTVMTHGSDYHYTHLIREHGKTIQYLYDLYINTTKL